MRTLRYLDFGYRRDEELETIEWKGPHLPSLDGKGWYRMKTLDRQVGTLYRSQVLCLRFVRNSWSQLVRVEFDYTVEKYIFSRNAWFSC